MLLTNCSQLTVLPNLSSLGNLLLLDLENCTGLRALPVLPAGLDVLILTGCMHMHQARPEDLEDLECEPHGAAAAAGVSAREAGGQTIDLDMSCQEPPAAVSKDQEDVRSKQGGSSVAQAIQALPLSLTQVHVVHCPMFEGAKARALLSSFLLSNRLLQWDRFKEADVLARVTQ